MIALSHCPHTSVHYTCTRLSHAMRRTSTRLSHAMRHSLSKYLPSHTTPRCAVSRSRTHAPATQSHTRMHSNTHMHPFTRDPTISPLAFPRVSLPIHRRVVSPMQYICPLGRASKRWTVRGTISRLAFPAPSALPSWQHSSHIRPLLLHASLTCDATHSLQVSPLNATRRSLSSHTHAPPTHAFSPRATQ